MPLGPRDTLSLVTHPGWDDTELRNFQLQDGTNFQVIVSQMNAALGALNSELTSDPLWSGLYSYQSSPEAEYRTGQSNGFGDFTEYGRADPQRAGLTGHMLPLKARDRALGWTWNYLRKARMSQIQADIADAIQDARDVWRLAMLTRLLKRGDDSGAALGLGSTGLSPGFATAAASTGVDFTPPSWGGTDFTVDHEHYVAIVGGVFTNAVFADAKDELREHGHEPPYTFLAGKSDEAAIKDLTNFIPVASSLVAYGALQDLARVNPATIGGMSGTYPIGTIEDFNVYIVPGIPQYYGFGYKSYGPNSQRNPLRIRLEDGMTRPTVRAFPDPRSGAGAAYPLQWMMLFLEFGVGVGDRTNGTPRYVNNAAWSDGTPT